MPISYFSRIHAEMQLCITFLWTATWGFCQFNTASAQSTKNQTFCECVPVYQCTFKRQRNSPAPLDIRVDSADCPNLLDVCCSHEDIVLDTYDSPPPKTTSPPPCGRPYLPDPNLRILGDSEASYGEYPWMAALLTPERHFICGGSLIHPQVVLTAAHCVLKLQTKVVVRLGEWDSQTRAEPLPLQSRVVSEIVPHEQFTPGSLFNDIALLFLDSPVELGGNVGTVCLPDANEDMEGRQCLASGWGTDAFGDEGKHPDVLRSVHLTITPREECLQALRGTRLGQYFRLHLSFLCAGGEEGKDSCEGDGGGPLVCPIQRGSDVYEQAGIVSWGVNCGQPTPAAYTNVALFRSWIDLQLLRHGLASY